MVCNEYMGGQAEAAGRRSAIVEAACVWSFVATKKNEKGNLYINLNELPLLQICVFITP